MELQSRDERKEVQKKGVSVLQGDGICISRILGRESSVGQSSRVFYRSNEGVPFQWEMQPGTAKNPQQEQDEDVIPPICPSPLMQSLGLPLPNLDDDDDDDVPPSRTSKIWRLREMMKKRIKYDIMKKVRGRNKEQESSRFSSICSSSSTFSSATSRVLDVSMADGPFCCIPWNIPVILEEGNTRIYYCSLHKNAFAVEEGDLFMSRILSEASAEEYGEVPFGWEMHPELIPPPAAAQSLSVPQAGRDDKATKSRWKKAWFWIRRGGGKRMQHEISFRHNEKWSVDGADASLRKAASIAPLSRGGGWRVSKIRRNLEGSLLRSRTKLLVFARTKWKSLA